MTIKEEIAKIIKKKVDDFFEKLEVRTDDFVDLKGSELKTKLKNLEKELQTEIDKEIDDYVNSRSSFWHFFFGKN